MAEIGLFRVFQRPFSAWNIGPKCILRGGIKLSRLIFFKTPTIFDPTTILKVKIPPPQLVSKLVVRTVICPKSADFRGYHVVKSQWPRRPLKGLKTVWILSANFKVVLHVKISQAVPVLAHNLLKSDLTGRASSEAKLLTDASIHS